MFFIVLLVFFGLLFLVAELVLLPGVSIGAILALVSYGGAIYIAFRDYGPLAARNRRRRRSDPFVRGDRRFAAIQNLAPFLFETEGRFLCDARTGAAECPCRRYGNDRFAPGPDGQSGDRR